jgi:hypothetical protein
VIFYFSVKIFLLNQRYCPPVYKVMAVAVKKTAEFRNVKITSITLQNGKCVRIGRTVNMPNPPAIIWIVVLSFAKNETGMTTFFAAANSRTPDINISRIIIKLGYMMLTAFISTKIKKTGISKALSAIGSKQRPKFETELNLRDKIPSR